jgi:hypothetical protein
MGLGVTYKLHAMGEGKLFICDYNDQNLSGGATSMWSSFMTSVLSVANVQGYCQVSDARLSVVSLERRGGGLGLFVLNGSRGKVKGDIVFHEPVRVSDLSVALSARPQDAAGTEASPRFSLEVPAFGIFPLAVDGQQLSDLAERFIAADMEDVTTENFLRAGEAELPGLEDSVWN